MMDAINRVSHRLMMAIGRGKITQVDDSDVVQRHQVDRGPAATAVRDKTPFVGLFGLSSNPPLGSDVILLSVGGDWSNPVAIAHNHQQFRPKDLQPGDTCIYDVRNGQTVTLTATGLTLTDAWGNTVVLAQSKMTLTHATKIELDAPIIAIAGGGPAVARIGDTVDLSTGKILTGSAKLNSG